MTKRIYFSQYDTVWSLSKNEALKFASQAIENGYHDLSEYRALKRKPSYVEIHYCLDWDSQDWQEFISYVTGT